MLPHGARRRIQPQPLSPAPTTAPAPAPATATQLGPRPSPALPFAPLSAPAPTVEAPAAAPPPPPPAAVVPAPAAAEAPPAEGFSLGAALVRGVPDATCAEPQQQAPPDWQALLVRKHADAAVLSGLFTSCRGGRDLVLQHAPQIALELPLLLSQFYGQRVVQHLHIKSALSTRGRLPTRLHVDGWDERRTSKACKTLTPTAFLQSILTPTTTAGITEAVVRCNCYGQPPGTAVAKLLAALPSLTRLEMAHNDYVSIPPPSQLPKLREVSLSPTSIVAGMDILQWVSPYMTQLTSLHYDARKVGQGMTVLFTANTHAAHLTTLSLPQWDLTDQLLGLILDCAPAVEQLSVQHIKLAAVQDRQRVWGVVGLTVSPAGHQGVAHLPVCTAGRLRWQVKNHTYLQLEDVSQQGFDPDLLARLPEWQFDTPRLRVVPVAGLLTRDQPLALRNALTQLDTHLTTLTPLIELSQWQMTPQFVSTVATALPAESALTMSIDVGMFWGGFGWEVQRLQRLGPRVCSAAAGELGDGCAGWPWASLFLGQASIRMLAELLSAPLPAGGGLRTVYAGALTKEVLSMGDELTMLLPTVQWAPLSGRKINITLLECFPAHCLASTLSMLRRLRFVQGTEVCLTLKAVPMRRDTMAALESLPDIWPGALVFKECTWPLPPSEYARLAEHIPTSYTAWHVDCEQAVLDSICVGINEARARLGARALTVYANIHKVRRVGKHVVLKHAPCP